MNAYDNNKDSRLTKQEITAMAYDISTGDVNERVVNRYWK